MSCVRQGSVQTNGKTRGDEVKYLPGLREMMSHVNSMTTGGVESGPYLDEQGGW